MESQTPTQQTNKTFKKVAIALAALVILAGLAAYFLSRRGPQVVQVDHLIAGVPAYTLYNTFMDMEPTYIDSTKSILDYWGHPPVSLGEIKQALGAAGVTSAEMNSFFQKRGYETELFDAGTSGYTDEALFNKIKGYVQRDIPVIVRQQRTTNPDDVADGTRVVIGMSDKTQKVTVHDYQYGNNYEISYDNFNMMSRLKDGGASMLAVWPGSILKQRLVPGDHTKPYTAWNPAMQRIGDLWQIRANALEYGSRGDMPKSIEILKIMVAKDDFKNLLPPAYQYGVYDCLVRRLFAVNKPDEVVMFGVNNMEPIDHDLNKPFDFWTGQISLFDRIHFAAHDKIPYHYFWLGHAYTLLGKTDEAKKQFKEGIALEPNYYKLVLQAKKAIMGPVLKSMKELQIVE